jgi:hypothetical protein
MGCVFQIKCGAANRLLTARVERGRDVKRLQRVCHERERG